MFGLINKAHENIRQEVRSVLERIALPIRDQIEEQETIPMELIRKTEDDGAMTKRGAVMPLRPE